VWEGGVVWVRGAQHVGRVGQEQREHGGVVEAGVHDGGWHLGEPCARAAIEWERVWGQEEEQLR
jgi:hypothetical protein